jgi:hypothetical protein
MQIGQNMGFAYIVSSCTPDAGFGKRTIMNEALPVPGRSDRTVPGDVHEA